MDPSPQPLFSPGNADDLVSGENPLFSGKNAPLFSGSGNPYVLKPIIPLFLILLPPVFSEKFPFPP